MCALTRWMRSLANAPPLRTVGPASVLALLAREGRATTLLSLTLAVLCVVVFMNRITIVLLFTCQTALSARTPLDAQA